MFVPPKPLDVRAASELQSWCCNNYKGFHDYEKAAWSSEEDAEANGTNRRMAHRHVAYRQKWERARQVYNGRLIRPWSLEGKLGTHHYAAGPVDDLTPAALGREAAQALGEVLFHSMPQSPVHGKWTKLLMAILFWLPGGFGISDNPTITSSCLCESQCEGQANGKQNRSGYSES